MGDRVLTKRQKAILEQEIALLNLKGTTLGLFSCRNNQDVPFTWTLTGLQGHKGSLKPKKDSQTNVRALYYGLLSVLFEGDDNQTSQQLLVRLKDLVYSSAIRLDAFNVQDIPVKYRDIYDNRLFKKLFVQWIELLSHNRGEGCLVRLLGQYPIADLIMIVIIRAIYIRFHRLQDDTAFSNIYETLPTAQLVQAVQDSLSIKIGCTQDEEYLFVLGGLGFAQKSGEIYIQPVGNSVRQSLVVNNKSHLTMDEVSISRVLEAVEIEEHHVETHRQRLKQFQQELHKKFKKTQKESKEIVLSKNPIETPTTENISSSEEILSGLGRMELKFANTIDEIDPQDLTDASQMIHPRSQIKGGSFKPIPFTHKPQTAPEFNICDGLTSPSILKLLRPNISLELSSRCHEEIRGVSENCTQSRLAKLKISRGNYLDRLDAQVNTTPRPTIHPTNTQKQPVFRKNIFRR